MAENIILIYGSYSDVGVLSGGGWQPTQPLSNLQRRGIHRVARSLDVQPSNTLFNVQLAGPATLKALCLGPGNISTGHAYRITADGVDVTGGWVLGAARAEWNTLTFEDPAYWTGVPAWDDPERGMWIIHVFEAPVTAMNWLIEVDDQANSDGFLQFARLVMGRYWQPSINYGYGSNGLSFKDASFESMSLAGSKRFWRRTNPRMFRFGFDYIPEAELFDAGYEFQRIVGYDGEVFVIPDPADALNRQKRSFLATANTMDPLSQAAFGFGSTAFELEEVI
jgi:hypothetical protein